MLTCQWSQSQETIYVIELNARFYSCPIRVLLGQISNLKFVKNWEFLLNSVTLLIRWRIWNCYFSWLVLVTTWAKFSSEKRSIIRLEIVRLVILLYSLIRLRVINKFNYYFKWISKLFVVWVIFNVFLDIRIKACTNSRDFWSRVLEWVRLLNDIDLVSGSVLMNWSSSS